MGVSSIFHAVVASSLKEPSELAAKASQVLPHENVLVAVFPMTTGPVLNQSPSGFSPPSLLKVNAPSRTCRSPNVCAYAAPAAIWMISTQHEMALIASSRGGVPPTLTE